MSFLSRLFRKTPSPSAAPVASRPSASGPKPDPVAPKPDAAARAIASAAEERSLQAAIDARDFQVLARLVVEGTSTKTRQSAAHAIDDAEVLRQLVRDTRGGNDKGVYKILTTKREQLLEQSRQREQLQAEIAASAAALERHSQRPHDVLYGSSLEQFERRWNAVADQADPELRARVQQWVDQSRTTIADHVREAEALAARNQAAAEAAAEAARLRDQQMLESAAAAAESEQALEAQQRALREKQQAEQQALRQIAGLVRKAGDALSEGSTARAAGVRKAIDDKLAGAPSLPPALAAQIQQLDQRLLEFQDWKRFSVAPKRAELITEMELLVGADFEPLALADKIKSLRDEWRTLGKGVADGTDENLEADWQRFNDAAQKAYLPCSEYFAAQARIREDNLRHRDAILARLTTFELEQDWSQPGDRIDWRAIIKLLRDAKEEWRQHTPVEREAGKLQQDKFSAVTASLQGRLDAEYARNIKLKESLIARAQALIASDDGRKAIETVKDLQQKWRLVGPVPREADQRLWTAFRQHSDAVFQKRQQEFDAFTASLENNKAQAIAVCEKLEAFAALAHQESAEHQGQLAELRSAFEALGEFPRADTQALRKRFDRGVERCEAALARQRARDAERSWHDLFAAANQVRAYRLAVACNQDPQQVESLKQAAEAFITAARRWPRNGLEALRRNLARTDSDDLAANETALRMLCIRAEILTDVPTPPEDQALRREYQLQRLVQRMGQGARTDDAQLDALAIEWVDVGPVEASVHDPLLQRFLRCRERGHAKAA